MNRPSVTIVVLLGLAACRAEHPSSTMTQRSQAPSTTPPVNAGPNRISAFHVVGAIRCDERSGGGAPQRASSLSNASGITGRPRKSSSTRRDDRSSPNR